MMDNEQKVSRKFLGMNSKVWLVIIIMLIISGGFVGYTMLKNEECVPIDFNVGVAPHLNDNFYYVGEEIPFKASRASNRISWNFNDDSDSIVGKAFVTHKFSKEGYYYVTLSTSLDCEAIRLVTIRNRNGSDTAEVAAMNKSIDADLPRLNAILKAAGLPELKKSTDQIRKSRAANVAM